jgi:co-chaperonin GroES (HSP10)
MIVPMTYKVLVKPDDLDVDPVYKNAQKAGLVIPDSEAREIAKMALDTGVVVALGSTAFRAYAQEAGVAPEEISPKVGDRVGYAKYAGKLQVDPETQEKFLILADEDINCVIRNAE